MTRKDYSFKRPKIKTNIFQIMEADNHEKLVFGYDRDSGLKVVLAIHNTVLGPSTGGTRIANVSEEEAIDEALRLSFAMTYKNAIIGEPYGGSKAVVVGSPDKIKTKKLLHALGDFIQSMDGSFLTGVDMGLTLEDAKVIGEKTDYIFNSQGCSGVTTVHGVYKGIKKCLQEVYGSSELDGITIAVQGLGYVGGTLVDLLLQHDVSLIISDIDSKVVNEVLSKHKGKAIEVAANDNIYDAECDVFSPCAIGGILNDDTIPRLKCKIVAGAANNQLEDEFKHSGILFGRAILHAPDFAINAGGVCHGMCEVRGEDVENALKKTDLIPGLLGEIFEESKKEKTPPMEIAYEIARRKLEAAAKR